MRWIVLICFAIKAVLGQVPVITNLNSDEIGETYAKFSWQISGEIYQYKLSYSAAGGSPQYANSPDASTTKYELDGLNPGTQYTITLTPYSMLEKGDSVTLNVLTCGAATNSITDVQATPKSDDNSLEVTWKGPQLTYTVTAWTPNGWKQSQTAATLKATFQNLDKSKGYYISIAPPAGNKGCVNEVLVGMIYMPAADRVPAVNLGVNPLGPYSLQLDWTLLANPTDLFVYGFNYMVANVNGVAIASRGYLDASATNVVVSGLEPATKYKVTVETVGLYSRVDTSKESSTPPGAPAAPVGLKTSVSTSKVLTVSWDAVPKAANYRVSLFIGSTLSTSQTVTATSATFGNVPQNVYYQVSVAAYTNPVGNLGGGFGPETSSGMQIEIPPTFPRPAAPTISSVEAIGSTAVLAKWTLVAEAYGYKLEFTATDKPKQTFLVPSMPTFGAIRGLESNTQYSLTISALSIDSVGLPSAPQLVSLPQGPPNPPTNVKLIKSADCKTRTTWVAPAVGTVDGYRVTVYLNGQVQPALDTDSSVASLLVDVPDGYAAIAEVKAFNNPVGGIGGGYSRSSYSEPVIFQPSGQTCATRSESSVDLAIFEPVRRVARGLVEGNLVSQVQNEGLGGAGSSSPGTAVAVAVAGVAGCAAFAVLATVVVHHRRAKAASTPVDVPLV